MTTKLQATTMEIRFSSMPSLSRWLVRLLAATLLLLASKSSSYSLFIVPITVHPVRRHTSHRRPFQSSSTAVLTRSSSFQKAHNDAVESTTGQANAATTTVRTVPKNTFDDDDDEDDLIMDDETLLNMVQKEQLVELCSSLNLSTGGTKPVLLRRLRAFAADRAKAQHDRRMARIQRVEEGSSADNPKERYEVINTNDDDEIGSDYFYKKVQQQQEEHEEDDEDDFVVFYESPEPINATSKQATTTTTTTEADKPMKKRPRMMPITSATLTAPPPPLEPNADGERVVTVYSTTDENDLTGIAAAQPGQASLLSSSSNVLTSTAAAGNRPWDPQSVQKKETDSEEVKKAKEQVTELVQTLLAMTGAPAFRITEDDDDAYEDFLDKMSPSYVLPTTFVGFNPGSVPTDLLTSCSRALRTSRGEVLQDVMRAFEIQAIGQDGMAVDKMDRGGGHYREVSKVRAFLEGYRRAEVRRVARQTAALLLDKLVQDGVEGLDITLASMTRSTDDTSDVAGELNDSLLGAYKKRESVSGLNTAPCTFFIPSLSFLYAGRFSPLRFYFFQTT
jgi:hypothetical protein